MNQQNRNNNHNRNLQFFNTKFFDNRNNNYNNNNNDWKLKNIDYFDSNDDDVNENFNSIINVDRHVIYIDVYVFVNKFKNVTFFRDNDKFKMIISQCFKNSIFVWHFMKLFDFKKNLFKNAFFVQ